jgi:hypothetical protein
MRSRDRATRCQEHKRRDGKLRDNFQQVSQEGNRQEPAGDEQEDGKCGHNCPVLTLEVTPTQHTGEEERPRLQPARHGRQDLFLRNVEVSQRAFERVRGRGDGLR